MADTDDIGDGVAEDVVGAETDDIGDGVAEDVRGADTDDTEDGVAEDVVGAETGDIGDGEYSSQTSNAQFCLEVSLTCRSFFFSF